jgi:hypothetical protein
MARSNSKGSSLSGERGNLVAALKRYHHSLVNQLSAIQAEVSAVEATIRQMGATTTAAAGKPVYSSAPATKGKGRGRHGPRPGSLKEFIVRALTGKGVMAVKDITAGVRDLGYKTKNKTLAKSVGIALAELKDRVQRVGRGKFKLR